MKGCTRDCAKGGTRLENMARIVGAALQRTPVTGGARTEGALPQFFGPFNRDILQWRRVRSRMRTRCSSPHEAASVAQQYRERPDHVRTPDLPAHFHLGAAVGDVAG